MTFSHKVHPVVRLPTCGYSLAPVHFVEVTWNLDSQLASEHGVCSNDCSSLTIELQLPVPVKDDVCIEGENLVELGFHKVLHDLIVDVPDGALVRPALGV